jgi:hypothetical protein
MNAFVDFSMAGLTGAEVKVWLILYRDTKATGLARTGQTDLARRARTHFPPVLKSSNTTAAGATRRKTKAAPSFTRSPRTAAST